MSFGYNVYTLETVPFIGGSTQIFAFNMYRTTKIKPFSLYRCKARFSVLNAINKTGIPILTKDMDIINGEGGIDNVLYVVLEPEDTVNLHGKYEYQITVVDTVDGKTESPGKGILYISNNIDKAYITG